MEKADLLTLAVEDGFSIVAKSISRGGQYNGPCPFCGGTDRFRVQPNHGTYGWFACNACGRKGSAIDYLMLKRGVSKQEALTVVGWMPNTEDTASVQVPQAAFDARPQWDEPPAQWQNAASAFYRHCQRVLWSEQGQNALAYLRLRGFTDLTIKAAKLGYHPRAIYGAAREWGRAVKLAQGIVIPWFFERKVWRITIRDERVAEGERRYTQVAGGSNGLYLADTLTFKRPLVVMTEGELDALSIAQECEKRVAIVATGTTQGSHTPRWISMLAKQEAPVLIAFDAEKNGDTAARWWIQRLENAQRLRPWWKDVNQMLQDGADLKEWLAMGLGERDGVHPIAPPEEEIALNCCVCGKEVECYSPDGKAFCEAHWEVHLHCCVCGKEVACYSPDGEAFCEIHWEERLHPSVVVTTQAPSYAHPLTSAQEIMALVEQWRTIHHDQMVIDLETTGLDPRTHKVVSIALGMPGQVTIIDMRGYYSSDSSHQQVWKEAVQQLLHRDATVWIGHNLKFDLSFLAHQFGVKLAQVYDTMLVEKLLHVGNHVSASLLVSAARYEITVTKEQQSWFIALDKRSAEWTAPFPDEQLTYIRQDIEVPYQIHKLQQESIARHDLARVVALEHRALPAIVAMERHGVRVDVERWRSILAVKRTQKAELEEHLKQVLGEAVASTQPRQETLFGGTALPAINLNSSDQLLLALRTLGVMTISTKKEVLQEITHQHPIIAQIVEWKALSNFSSAFGENLLSYVTSAGRIHATFDQLGAASGRIICQKPNLQQIPKPTDKNDPSDLRRCFVAPEGHQLLIADLSNIELRILAEVSGDTTMLRFFAEGKDLHSETARLMFKLAPDVDPKTHLVNGKKARDIAKTINFGLAYGMGAQGLANRVGVDLTTAKRLMQTYFATYKAVAAYLARSGKEGITKGYARSLSGRKRFFSADELKARRGEAERSAKNHPIQGTNADILKCALALLYHQLPSDVSVVLTVHDEIVLECPDARIEEATQILKDAMVQACREYLKVVRIPEPDVLVGSYWKKD
jgi:DNA polymerase I